MEIPIPDTESLPFRMKAVILNKEGKGELLAPIVQEGSALKAESPGVIP